MSQVTYEFQSGPDSSRPGADGTESGLALVIVLWLVLILGLIAGHALDVGRNDLRQAASLLDDSTATLLARGAVDVAVAHLGVSRNQPAIKPDGSLFGWKEHNHLIFVRVTPESGRVDLNNAAEDLISHLIRTVGGSATESQSVTHAVSELRNSGGLDPDNFASARNRGRNVPYFRNVSQLLSVPGMEPELYTKISPYVTVLSGRTSPDSIAAAPAVRAALRKSVTPHRTFKRPQISAQDIGGASVRLIVPGDIGQTSDLSLLRIETATVSPNDRTVAMEVIVSQSQGFLQNYRVHAMRRTDWLNSSYDVRGHADEP